VLIHEAPILLFWSGFGVVLKNCTSFLYCMSLYSIFFFSHLMFHQFCLFWNLMELFICLMQIDSNTDGLVDFTEFVAAALHVHQLEEHNSEKWQLRSQAAFEKFDIDRDGYITPEELRMVLIFLCIEYPALLYLFFMRN